MVTQRQLFLVLSLFLFPFTVNATSNITYVKTTGNDFNDGATWATALKTIPVALSYTSPGGSVWVAAGIYREHIINPNNISLYGGFAGNETTLNARNWVANKTILDGNHTTRILELTGGSNLGAVDGFTFRNGYADFGSAIYISGSYPNVQHNRFIANQNTDSGTIYVNNGGPLIANNIFQGNYANSWGAGIRVDGSTITNIVNNTFVQNVALGGGGGAIFCWGTGITIANNIIAYNSSGIILYGGSVSNNHNCLYHNSAYDYSNLSAGAGDVTTDPKLASMLDGNLHLSLNSSCINAGNNSAIPSGTLDMDGDARTLNSVVDIGADESNEINVGPAPINRILHVKPSGSDSSDGLTWATSKRTINNALVNSMAEDEIWTAAGNYQETVTLKPGVAIYGGFIGTETTRSQRNWNNNLTYIDGSGNTQCINCAEGIEGTAIVDGFTIRNGYGIYGGAVYLNNASPNFTHNHFVGNLATGGGAAFYVAATCSIIANNLFTSNHSNGYGGAIRSDSGYLEVINNTLVRNTALTGGGAIFNMGSGGINISNNIIAYNSSGVIQYAGTIALTHNCVYGNFYYDYYGISPGSTDISVNPQFSDLFGGNYHLLLSSPCVNAGANTQVVNGETDIDAESRIINSTVDIGADETNGVVVGTPIKHSILYVKRTGNNSNDGSSWSSAKLTIANAIAAAHPGDEVWVASGLYSESLTMNPDIGLYGGFNGSETQRSQRDWNVNVTTIDGGGIDRVITVNPGAGEETFIDGFVIKNGYKNYGAGIFASNASPTIQHNRLIGNHATDSGGAIWIDSSYSTISNNVFYGNYAANWGGGIRCDNGSYARIVNNTFAGNICYQGGGAIFCYGTNITVVNNIIAYNSSGTILYSGAIDFRNNCSYGNGAYDYSGVLQSTGNGNITADPKFAGLYDVNLHLLTISPCINNGSSSDLFSTSTDIDGQPRIIGSSVDMGADESDGVNVGPSPINRIIYVKTSGNNANNGSSWALAKKTIQTAISSALPGDEIWVAAGTYPENVVLSTEAALYGGFKGTETLRSQRDWSTHPSYIDAAGTGKALVAGQTITPLGIIDGFVIENGSSDLGGGIYAYNASPTIQHNTIINNYSSDSGAGIFLTNSFSYIANNTISNNNAVNFGAAIRVDGSSYPKIANNTIVYNFSSNGAALFAYGLNVTFVNNIAAFNSSGIQLYTGAVTMRNNDVYGNIAYNYSSTPPGTNDISVDPLLQINSACRTYHITPSSPCYNAGNNADVLNNALDMDGEARIYAGTVDIGADEYQPQTGPFVTLTGTVHLQGWVGSLSGEQVEVNIDCRGTTLVNLAGSGNTGTFTVQVPANSTFTLRVKPHGFLRETIPVTTGSGNISVQLYGSSGSTTAFTPGDINNDNIIDDTDLLAVINNFLSAPPAGLYDVNGDNLLDDTDLLAVINNFLSSGDM